MAAKPLHAGEPGPHSSQIETHPTLIPDPLHLPAAADNNNNNNDLFQRDEASRAPSEKSTHFDVSEHDFLSIRGPPSQRSTMATDTAAAGGQGGGIPRVKKHARRKLILCFDGTGNKFHGDDSDSNILKIFRMLDRTANDQCKYTLSPVVTLMF